MNLIPLARIVAIFGITLLVVAGILFLIARTDLPLGRLPGDIRIERGNFTCAFPLVTSLILSGVLTLILNLILYFLKK